MRSLRIQLLISHLLLVLLLVAVMSGAISNFIHLSHSIEQVLESNLSGILASEQMRQSLSNEQEGLRFYLAGQRQYALPQLRFGESSFNRFIANMKTIPTDGQIQDAIKEVERAHGFYSSRVHELILEDQKLDKPTAQADYLRQVEPALESVETTLHNLIRLNQEAILSAGNEAEAEAQRATRNSVIVTVIAFSIALFLAIRMIRIALAPLSLLAKHAEVIGGGDLTRQLNLNRSDEIGNLAEAFNSMAAKLADMRKSEIRKLQRAERMSDAALESLYDPVIVTDARARIVHLNSSAEVLFGPVPITPRVNIEAHVSDERIVNAVRNAIQQETTFAGEDEALLVPIQVAGAKRTYRLRVNPMRTEDGLILGAVAVLEDITHLKEIDRLKNEFIGVASHELRTPVTSLLLSVQLLQEGAAGELNPQQTTVVNAQRQDLDRLDRLMRELLDITRLEAGTSVPRMARVFVAEFMESALAATGGTATKAGVRLWAEPTPPLAVLADRSQILRILINLIDNAVRHTKAGGTVVLRAEAAGDDVLFSVEDTGEGIPNDYLANIFERFVQVPGATQGGAGLGLSIAKTIVEAHGGSMTVTSTLGKGSTFFFSLKRDMAVGEGD